VSNAGDVDNDNYDNVIIGAPFNDDGGSDAGKAYVYSVDSYAYVTSYGRTLGYATDWTNANSASDGGAYATLSEEDDGEPGGNEYLYVDGRGNEKTGWDIAGSTPFLDSIDGTNRIYTASDGAEEGDFTFSDSSVAGIFSSSQIELYSQQGGSDETVEVFMHDGSSWQSMGTITPDSTYSWKSLSTTSFLDSKVKIDAAKMYVKYAKSGGPGTVDIDAARIYWSATSYTLYKMDIQFGTNNVKSADDYILELNYSTSGTETDFGVLIYNNTASDWDDQSWRGDLGRNETNDVVNSTLSIEYHRIKSANISVKLTGANAGDNFGWSVGNVSDINQDGTYDDVIVGAPGYSSSTGRAYIYHGSSSFDSTADLTLTGENSGDKFGFSVHGAGDTDLDGAPDVAVGAPYYDNGANTDAGIVYVFKGGSSMDTTYDYFFKGTQANQHFGWSVGLALNIDGSSYSNIVVGSPDYDDSGTDEGQAMVLAAIPEFPTIVIPIISIVILISAGRYKRQKKKKENNR
jgi:hypothetical protein